MKIHNLLVILVVSTFTNLAAMPWSVLAQTDPTTQENLSTTAQQEAPKITVKIRVGQGGGSGVMLAKKGSTYLVLTNAHVVNEQTGATITTPDGQSHVAQRVKNTGVGKFDLALLEFNSVRNYELAKLDNFRKPELSIKQPVFSAGFPHDASSLRLLDGKITQLPQEAFMNGTQVGYVTQGDLIQGMSGGPVLDSNGSLVGINSTLARPIIDNYVYADGRKAPLDRVAEYREANWSVPMYNLLTRLNPDILYSYKQLPRLHRSVTPTGYMAELDQKARAVTVRIEKGNGKNGSGVIVAKDGNNYYVLTADHVVKNSLELKVVTHDQRIHQINTSDVKRSEGTDLAVVKFTSNESYQSATLGNYSVAAGAIVFAGGWPNPEYINSQQWQWQLNPGNTEREVEVQDKRSFNEGYNLIYSSLTYAGMSGSPVFNTAGQVVGIHGKAEGINNGIRKNILGNSLGISINTFLNLLGKLGVDEKDLKVITSAPKEIDKNSLTSIDLVRKNIPIPTNASDVNQWIEYGNQLYRYGEYSDAVKAFDQAILLEPSLIDAHYGKALALVLQAVQTKQSFSSLNLTILTSDEGFVKVIDSLSQAIDLVPKNKQSSFYYLWKYRSISLLKMKRYAEATLDISKAISLEPEDIGLFNIKANIFQQQNQYSKAILVYDQIINLNPKTAWAYNNRGAAKASLGNYQDALNDFDIAIQVNPQSDNAYFNRGDAKFHLEDKKGAISDYNILIKIRPRNALAYYRRGAAQYSIGNGAEAKLDFDMAEKLNGVTVTSIDGKLIHLAPTVSAVINNDKDAMAYYNRGNQKFKLGDEEGAVSDFTIAININPKFFEAYQQRGHIKDELKDFNGAIADFEAMIRINPQSYEAHYSRGKIKAKSGDINGAIIDFNSVIALDYVDSDIYFDLGAAKLEAGDNKGAIISFDTAIKIYDKYSQAYYKRGLAKYRLNDNKGASTDFDAAIKITPHYSSAHYMRGIIKYYSGDKKGAFEDVNIAIKNYSEYDDAYLFRGIIQSDWGNYNAALIDLNTTIAIRPNYAGAYNNRGLAKYQLKDIQGAIADYDIAVKLDPNYAAPYNNRGLLKSNQAAINDFDIAIRLDPNYISAYINRGNTKYMMGDKKGAISDLNTAAQLYKSQSNLPAYEEVLKTIQQYSK